MRDDFALHFELLWTQHADKLLDRQQIALWKCYRDAPEKLFALFDHYLTVNEREKPKPLNYRYCIRCQRVNKRRKNKLCYACYRADYLASKRSTQQLSFHCIDYTSHYSQ